MNSPRTQTRKQTRVETIVTPNKRIKTKKTTPPATPRKQARAPRKRQPQSKATCCLSTQRLPRPNVKPVVLPETEDELPDYEDVYPEVELKSESKAQDQDQDQDQDQNESEDQDQDESEDQDQDESEDQDQDESEDQDQDESEDQDQDESEDQDHDEHEEAKSQIFFSFITLDQRGRRLFFSRKVKPNYSSCIMARTTYRTNPSILKD